MATQGSTWYVDFFRDDYLNVYDHLFTAERAEKEVAFAGQALDLKAGARVLDLLDALHGEFGFAQVTATHDADVAARFDRAVGLADGKLAGTEQFT